MFKAVLGLAVAAGLATTLFVGTASADPYKWCAVYGLRDNGGVNCGFVTLQQCQATIFGIGGTCELNPRYTGPEKRPARRAPRRHRD